jgi:hypothetical protein
MMRLIKLILIAIIVQSCLRHSDVNENRQTVTAELLYRFKGDHVHPILDFDFDMKRQIYNDSSFLDYPLLCSCDSCKSCGITFKKQGQDWYVKADDEWQKFFDAKKERIELVHFKSQEFILRPYWKTFHIGDRTLLGFIKDDYYRHSSDINLLWFDREYGVVVLGDTDHGLTREDFKNGT